LLTFLSIAITINMYDWFKEKKKVYAHRHCVHLGMPYCHSCYAPGRCPVFLLDSTLEMQAVTIDRFAIDSMMPYSHFNIRHHVHRLITELLIRKVS